MSPKEKAIWLLLLGFGIGLILTPVAQARTFTLNEAIDYALTNNKELAASREDIEAARGVKQTAWSNVLPHLTAEAGYTYLSEVPEINVKPKMPSIPGVTLDPIEIKQKMGDNENYKAELKLNQLIFASGGAFKGIQAATAAERAARHQVAASEEDLARQVSERFYSVLFAREVYKAQAESLKTSEAHLADVQSRFKFGASSKYELLRSEVEVANLRPQVDKAENAVRLAAADLARLIGLPYDEPLEVSGSLDDLVLDLEYQQAMDEALGNREEFKGLAEGIQAQKALTWASTAGMLPKVVAFGSYGWQKPWYFEEDGKDLWTVGAGLSIPLFDGLSAWGAREQAAAGRRKLEKQKTALTEGIDFMIRRALLDLSEIQVRIGQTKDNVNRAEEAYRMAEEAYRNGVVTNLELMDAQLALTGAKTAHIQSMYDFQIAKTQLLAAAGKLR